MKHPDVLNFSITKLDEATRKNVNENYFYQTHPQTTLKGFFLEHKNETDNSFSISINLKLLK